MTNTLKQRLLRDIAELQSKPYPNIALHVQDDDLTQACLVLTVEGYGPMHLTVTFPDNFPLSPPRVGMDSNVYHPNIFGGYICASILNTTEGYTPAYTLKGIAIQLLSFFSSDKIEQVGGYSSVDLKGYRATQSHILGRSHTCTKCMFGLQPTINSSVFPSSPVSPPSSMSGEELDVHWPTPQQNFPKRPTILGRNARRKKAKENAIARAQATAQAASAPVLIRPAAEVQAKKPKRMQDMKLPNEILLMICKNLETEDLMVFAEAWEAVGHVMTEFDVIRTRELQCFCLKKDYKVVKLGVGVSVVQRGRFGSFESEFDLVSYEGYQTHRIRRSIFGSPFQHWIPLPISRGHWNKVRDDVRISLSSLSTAANLGAVPPVHVIYHFMNDIVVKLNTQASEATSRSPYYPYEETAKSTLTHASEKAIESYFHLFHLLLCIAISEPAIVKAANDTLRAFGQGKSSKIECPNLGHLLVDALISDVEMSDDMIKSIVQETITRNVVWMLDSKGANMPELAYLEPSDVSQYRLQKTFDASKTSYRLLMFLNLFRKTAVGNPRKPLTQLRDEAFERHGAPPRGSAKGLADSIKAIHRISSFPEFLAAMDIGKPSATWFTNFLKDCMEASVKKGYSKMPLTQNHALALRQRKEPGVQVAEGVYPLEVDVSRVSFFPGKGGFQGNRGNGRRR
jgi:ubiquitin-protein ligase